MLNVLFQSHYGGAQVEPKQRNVVVWVKQKHFVLQVHLKSFQHFSYSFTLQQQSSQKQ